MNIDFDSIARTAASDAVKAATTRVIDQLFGDRGYGNVSGSQEAVRAVCKHMLETDPELQALLKKKLTTFLEK